MANGLLDHNNPKDFARFWSAVLFLFLVPDAVSEKGSIQKIMTDRVKKKKEKLFYFKLLFFFLYIVQ